jgi:hypothetical protein
MKSPSVSREATPATTAAPSYDVAALVALAVLTIYVATLGPSTAPWDTSEYITAAYTLGLPHPPGNPLFVLLGRVFSLLPIAPSVAQRINLLSAVMSAITAGVWFLVAERVVGGRVSSPWLRRAGGCVAALLSATVFTVWNQSVVNEKVYTVSLCFFAIVSWLTILWCQRRETRSADRLLVLIAFLLGLGYSNHPAGLLVAPAVAAAVLATRATTLLRWRLLVAGAMAFVLGLTPFAYEPIRAAQHPALNEGEPTGCGDRIGWSCTFSAETKARLLSNVNRDQYGQKSVVIRQAPFSAQLGMWWQYFQWQWMRDARVEHPSSQSLLAMVFLLLAIAGGVFHWNNDRRSFWFFGALVATVTVVLVYYMNFKYGFTQAPLLGQSVDREVRDRDYFFIWSFSTVGVWAALGLVSVWARLAEALRGTFVPEGERMRPARRSDAEPSRRARRAAARPGTIATLPRRAWLLASPVLLVALIPLFANWRSVSHRGDTFTRDMAIDLLNSVEPYGVLITNGDNDTFPLWYAQEVEGIRRDVTVAVTSLLDTDWYVRMLLRRPVYEYNVDTGPAIYRDRVWKRPTGPPLTMSIAQANAVPDLVPIDSTVVFRADHLEAIIDPRALPDVYAGHPVLRRADVLVLRMIADTAPERSVFISRTAGGYGTQMGLAPYMMTQGLARKIVLAPLHASHDTVNVAGDGFVNVPFTQALWNDLRSPDTVIRRDLWVDVPSLSMPLSLVDAGRALASALVSRGDTAAAAGVVAKANRIVRAIGLGGTR